MNDVPTRVKEGNPDGIEGYTGIQERLRLLGEVQMPAHLRDRVRDRHCAGGGSVTSGKPCERQNAGVDRWKHGCSAGVDDRDGCVPVERCAWVPPDPPVKQAGNMVNAESPKQGFG
jgi:hypothetical protein